MRGTSTGESDPCSLHQCYQKVAPNEAWAAFEKTKLLHSLLQSHAMRSVGGDEDADGAREGAFQGGPDRDVRYNPSPLSDTAFRYHKYMQFLKQIYLPVLLLLIALDAILVKMKLQIEGFRSVPWQVIFVPLWIGTVVNTIATSYELRLSNRSRRTKTYVIEHVNHLIFWLTISIVLVLLCFKLNGTTAIGITILLFPLYLALITQNVLYFF